MRRSGLPVWLAVTAIALAAPGCKDDDGGDDGADTSGTDDNGDDDNDDGPDTSESDTESTTSMTSAETGTESETDTDGGPIEFAPEDVYGVPNLDDDDEDGNVDWFQPVFAADNDVTQWAMPGLPEGYTVTFFFNGALGDIRIWDGTTFAIGTGDTGSVDEYTFEPGPDGTTLDVVFGEYNVEGRIVALVSDPNGAELMAHEVNLRAAPLIMNHHLQPSEHTWVMDTDAAFGNNAAMVADFSDALGNTFTAFPGNQYGFDVWVQDEFELATLTAPGDKRLNVAIDSIRDRGLDDFPEDYLEGPDFSIGVWGNPAQATTWDSFGNLEATPPVTVGGTEYPFGRIYYGAQGSLGLHPALAGFLGEQKVQAPIEVDTFWLCVGHVDEFSSFVPDPDSDKGFKLLLSDVDAAYELLEGLDASMSITRYGQDHGHATVGAILNDAGLRALNEDLQADEIDPIKALFMSEFGIEESDIIYIPSLFETIGGCGGGTAALIPGMVNLIVADDAGGDTHLFIPDPFFRTNVNDQSSDPVIADFTSRMPDGVELHYVDNWDVYHLGLGEVHCGTNVQRTPAGGDWWTDAMHLLED